MKHLKTFENFSTVRFNESIGSKLLIPFLVSLGYFGNAQNVTNDDVYSVLTNNISSIIKSKSELDRFSYPELVGDKAKLVYDFINNTNKEISELDFTKFCNTNNINSNILDRFIDITNGSFISNIKGFGNVYKANLNISKNVNLFYTKDPFNNYLGIKLGF